MVHPFIRPGSQLLPRRPVQGRVRVSCSGRDKRCVLGALDVADVVRLQGGEALADGEQVLVADLRVDGAERARRVLDGTGIRRAVLHLDLEGSRDVRALRSHDSSPFR